LGYEYKIGNQVLDLFDQVLNKDVQKTFIYGNHSARFLTYMKDIDNKKIADVIPSPEQALKLSDRGYTVMNNWKEDFLQVGPYQLFHGIYCRNQSS